MKNVYPVFFTQTEDIILIEVPDFGILTQGKNMNDAIDMARDAMELYCISLEDAKEDIPLPSELKALSVVNGTFAKEGETFISLVDIDSEEYRRKIDTRIEPHIIKLEDYKKVSDPFVQEIIETGIKVA